MRLLAIVVLLPSVLLACGSTANSGQRGPNGEGGSSTLEISEFPVRCDSATDCSAQEQCMVGPYAAWISQPDFTRCLVTCTGDNECAAITPNAYCLQCPGFDSACALPDENERWSCDGFSLCNVDSDCNTGCCTASVSDSRKTCAPGSDCGGTGGSGGSVGGCQAAVDCFVPGSAAGPRTCRAGACVCSCPSLENASVCCGGSLCAGGCLLSLCCN